MTLGVYLLPSLSSCRAKSGDLWWSRQPTLDVFLVIRRLSVSLRRQLLVDLERRVRNVQPRSRNSFCTCTIKEGTDDGLEFAGTPSFDVEEHRRFEIDHGRTVVLVFRTRREPVASDATERVGAGGGSRWCVGNTVLLLVVLDRNLDSWSKRIRDTVVSSVRDSRIVSELTIVDGF